MSRSRIEPSAAELRVVLSQLLRRLRAEYDVPVGHGTVLGRLEREGPKTTSELAAAERMRPQSMAQTVGELETQGLVGRKPDTSDRRRVLIEITASGRRRLEDERRRRADWLAQAIRDELTPDERRTLLAAVPLLKRLADR